ncbi:glycosyltransferase [Salinicola sp. MIT1003]|uniref:glycosyltransferase family 2 protein n=1 Tax=Salinicola sp. MIT1003 TaxID=1882734 RepID=UPI0008DCB8C3|nr:glycosyltransferase [Salinicola sp. MIT1003]
MNQPSDPTRFQHSPVVSCQARLTGLNGNMLEGWAYDPAQPQRRWVVAIHGDGRLLALEQAERFHPEAPGDGQHGFQVMLSDAQLDATRNLKLTLANQDDVLASLALPAAAPARHTSATSRVVWQPGLVLRGWLVDPQAPHRQLQVEAREGDTLLASASPRTWITHTDETVEGGFRLRLPLSLADGKRHELIITDSDGRELAGSPLIVQEWPQGLRQWLAAEPEGRMEKGWDKSGQNQRGHTQKLIERQLARYEQLLPRGVDLAEYPHWARLFAFDAATGVDSRSKGAASSRHGTARSASAESAIGIIGLLQLGEGELALGQENRLQVRRWTLADPDDEAAYREALDAACHECDAVLQLEPGDRLPEGALALAWDELQRHDAAILYSDFDAPMAQDDPRRCGGFLPAWDPDRHWCQDYLAAGLCLVSSAVLRGHPHPPESPHEFSYAARERCNDSEIRHIPQVLRERARPWPESHGEEDSSQRGNAIAESTAQTRRLARLNGRLERHDPLARLEAHSRRPGLRRLVRTLEQWPSVTLIIPTRDALGLLHRCVDTLLAHTDYPGHVRLLIVDNQSQQAETHAWFDEQIALGTRPLGPPGERQGSATVEVLSYPHAFNYAAINNAAVAHLDERQRGEGGAKGDEVIGLINNDIEALHADWLQRMVALLLRPGTGAVGAKLQWPNAMVQHGGVIGGVHGLAAHVGNAWHIDDSGYLGMNHLTQRFSAVTAACLLMRRADYTAVGGLDARDFPVGFNDVDLCLKLRARGQAIVWTPEARLIHAESATRGKDESAEKAARAEREMANLRRRWGNALAADPAYNPNLSLDVASDPYTSLALPPRPRHSRANALPH